MSNELAKIDDYSALDAAIGNEGMSDEPLKFKGGRFERGFGLDKYEVKPGTKMMLHPASTSAGFVKWEDGRPSEKHIRELNAGLPILREALGDLDESKWPDGKDPYVATMMVALKDLDGNMLAFTTSSTGGKNAIRKVLRDWKLVRHQYDGKVPIVALSVGSYLHKVHHTNVEFPVFEIVDWGSWDGAELPELTAGQQIRSELNDEIPFAPEWR